MTTSRQPPPPIPSRGQPTKPLTAKQIALGAINKARATAKLVPLKPP